MGQCIGGANVFARASALPPLLLLYVKVKVPLTIRSSRERLWGCSGHLALLAEGPGVQLPGHVASMIKPLLANQSNAWKRRLPSCWSSTYLSACTLMCFRNARLAGAGTEQRELTLLWGFEPAIF